MKKIMLLVVVLFSLNASLTSATNVPGGIVSGVWTLSGSPYNIQGSIQIPNDSTLVIQPGVTVNFQGSYKINVQGRLLAMGTITDSITFIPNDTIVGWRGIHFYNNLLTNDTSFIKYCKIQHCKPTDTYGAIHIDGWSKLVLSHCYISKSSYNGIYCTGNCFPLISDNYISENLNFGIECYFAYPPITNNNICNNFNTGIHCALSNDFVIQISNNTICNNTGGQGGGLYLDNGSYSVISNNKISNNHALSFGGGVYIRSAPHAQLLNNIIANNSADYSGGGVYCWDYSGPDIINNTISNNSALNGGAFACALSGNPTFKNCIFWGNSASSTGSQVFIGDESSDPDFYYCDIQGGSAMFELNGNIYTGTYSNNIDVSPLFSAPSGGSGLTYNGITADWSLQNTSPCIDTGDPTINTPATDFAGNTRVTVCRIDVGAYEYQTGMPLNISLSITQAILCNGAATGAITSVVSGGTPPYSYLWSNGDTTANISGLVAGNYFVTVSESSYGCALVNNIILPEQSIFIVEAGANLSIICGATAQLNYVTSNFTGPGTLSYKWTPSTGLNSDTIPNPGASIFGNITYTVTVTTPDGCIATDNVSVFLIPMNAPEICIVGVDSANNNMVVWNRPASIDIDSIYIYRETDVTGIYEKIGAVPNDSISIFVDPLSSPDVQSNKYKLSISDNCGLDSEQSEYHKTMHLAINQGMGNIWNLIWDPYEGFIVSTYKIYRGSAPGNLQLIGTTSGGNTQYSDLLAPGGYVYYQIEVISPNSCNPSKSYNSSRSNIASNSPFSVFENIDESDLFSIYPNPANDKIEIAVIQKSEIEILDVDGRILKSMIMNYDHASIDISVFASGIYYIKVKSEKGVAVKKFIKK